MENQAPMVHGIPFIIKGGSRLRTRNRRQSSFQNSQQFDGIGANLSEN